MSYVINFLINFLAGYYSMQILQMINDAFSLFLIARLLSTHLYWKLKSYARSQGNVYSPGFDRLGRMRGRHRR